MNIRAYLLVSSLLVSSLAHASQWYYQCQFTPNRPFGPAVYAWRYVRNDNVSNLRLAGVCLSYDWLGPFCHQVVSHGMDVPCDAEALGSYAVTSRQSGLGPEIAPHVPTEP